MFKKIAVGLDGSELSDRALDFAMDLAEKYSASLLLLTVVQPIRSTAERTMASAFPPISEMEVYEQMKKYHAELLSDAFERAKKIKPNLDVSTRLLEGRPADEIVEEVKKEKYDLAVLGHRGSGGVREFLLGSASHRVADQASSSVLIVK